ncbi:MAG: tetratricopeptide repeat protein [Bacteroidia bacterium]
MLIKKFQVLINLLISTLSFAFGQSERDLMFNNGLRVFEKGYYISAIEYFDHAINIDSTFAIAYYYKGLAYKKGTFGDIHPDIVSNFKKAIELDTIQNFWEAYYYLARLSVFIDKSYDTLFDKAIKLQPNNSDIYLDRGFNYLMKRDFNNAILDFEKSLQLNSTNFDALKKLASCYLVQKKDLDKALDCYNKALKIKPKDIGLLIDRTRVFCKLGKISKAKQDLKTLNKINQKFNTIDADCNIIYD